MNNLELYNNYAKTINQDICFVLGSGPSLTTYDLEPLKKFTVFAVNSAYEATPWSDFFVSDDWSIFDKNYFKKDLVQSDKTIALLYEDKLKSWSKLFKDRCVLFRHRTGYHLTRPYLHNQNTNYICQARTSVGSAMHIAYIMGFTTIILLGVDCCWQNDARYHWEINTIRKQTKFSKIKYNLVNTDSDLMDILRYWNKYGKNFNQVCKVYNASPMSLVRSFEKIDLNDLLKSGKIST